VGVFFARVVTFFTRFYPTVAGLAYCALLTTNFFSEKEILAGGPTLPQIALFGVLVFLFSWRLALAALSAPVSQGDYFKLELAFLLFLVLLTVLQATGGLVSPLFPVFYLLAGLMVAFVGIWSSCLLTAFSLAVLIAHRWEEEWSAPDRLIAAAGMSLVFVLIIGLYLKIARDRTLRAQRALVRLTTEARELAEPKESDASGLSREEAAKADVGALLQLDRVLDEIAETAKRAMTAHTCLIAFAEEDQRTLVVRGVSSDETPPADVIGQDLADTALMRAVQQGQNVEVEDLGRFYTRGRHRSWGTRPRALLAAPLREGQRVIGVIAVDRLQPYHFGQDEERFLEMMARRVVEALGRERAFRQLTAQKTEIAAFHDIIKKLTSSIDLDTVSRVILESGQAIIRYDYGVLAHIEADNQTGAIVAVAGLPPEKWLGQSFSLTESLVGWVVGSKTYLHYPRLQERLGKAERRRPVFAKDLALKNVESLLCLPLLRRNFVTDILVFGLTEPEAFTTHEIKFFEVLAVQAAVSLENASVHARMEELATTDGLTGCFNHRYFQGWLEQELARTSRMPIEISLVMTDIDHFKKINDTYGHPVGDIVLRHIAQILQSSVRQNDLVARYGGEEFALVLLHSDPKGATRFADRVREKIARTEIACPGGKLTVTVSMGIAGYPQEAQEQKALIRLADEALYAAKQGGRNRVVHAHELSLQQT
jgi:diguanylate cyclase (GGDEF)-like protein